MSKVGRRSMNICIIADMDPGAQCATLWKAFMKHTDNDVRYIVGQSTYLGYDEDLNTQTSPKEEIEKAIKESDFYIIIPVCAPISLPNLNRNNHLVYLVGSLARNNPYYFLHEWLRKDTMLVTSMDYSYSSLVGASAQHIPISLALDEIPARRKTSDKIRVVHSPTSRQVKSTEIFLEAMKKVEQNNPNVETVLIEKKPWKESLQIKSTCDISYDQCTLGAYGAGAVESMAMGQVVLGRTNKWVKSFFTERIPIVDCTHETIRDLIEQLIRDEGARRSIGAEGRRFVEEHHDIKKNIIKWENLIEFCMEGRR